MACTAIDSCCGILTPPMQVRTLESQSKGSMFPTMLRTSEYEQVTSTWTVQTTWGFMTTSVPTPKNTDLAKRGCLGGICRPTRRFELPTKSGTLSHEWLVGRRQRLTPIELSARTAPTSSAAF